MARLSNGKIAGIVIGGLAFLFLVSAGCFFMGLIFGGTQGNVSTANIYEIRIEGTISASYQGGLISMGATTPEQVISQLDAAEKDRGIKAILLRVNSPGGSPAASQEIFEELKKVKKPVVVSVADSCASGAYYIACGADAIVANRSSSVGSIGVIMQVANLEDLYDKLGIEYTTIKQGKYKDVGSSSRPMSSEEKQLLEDQAHKVYMQFVQDVASAREMTEQEVLDLATGWVFLGTEALELGLIDELGTYKDALETAARMGGIKGEPVVTSRQQFSIMDLLWGLNFPNLRSSLLDIPNFQGYEYR